ncbi:conserved membrane hypothetical protein [Methylocella tundrae]|uniref:DUF4239 domain-containing protein n=1 Tax=Methylocella tundrae TaxID=227605 RepID=A0A8B6M4X0_METTU|nr:DUF4239 domain-containing protein [Methylocella tundrae]VTZ49403.1 conserved membrane hypothetical protein [Methylocella tundrae]
MIDAWLTLSLPYMVFAVAGFYTATAAFLFWLSFGRLTRRWMLSFNGAIAELFSAIMVIFGIQIGFVASDIWDRNRRASAAVETESASLTMLNALASASGLPADGIRQAIRVYVTAVTGKEWPSMAASGMGAPQAEDALGGLLRTVAATQHNSGDASAKFDALLLDMALKVQAARADRLVLSAPYSESIKWACVLILALTGQISIAMLHLDRPRPHLAAMVIFTSSLVLIIVLIAANEGPFQPPLAISSDPIARVLELLPKQSGEPPAPAPTSKAI